MYVAEAGLDNVLIRDYGYCPKGQRLMEERSGLRFACTSIIAGLHENKPITPMYFKGYCNTKVVLTWVKKMLIPDLKAGMTVIWDNAAFHKSPLLQEAFAEAGVSLLFLPAYKC